MKQWVNALRSGKYDQGKGYLCLFNPSTNQYKHCCLGVLTDLYINQMRKSKKANKTNLENYNFSCQSTAQDRFYPAWLNLEITHEERDACVLPKAVAEWAGINTNIRGWDVGNIQHIQKHLADLNDGLNSTKPKTFSEIADLIEKYYEQL